MSIHYCSTKKNYLFQGQTRNLLPLRKLRKSVEKSDWFDTEQNYSTTNPENKLMVFIYLYVLIG